MKNAPILRTARQYVEAGPAPFPEKVTVFDHRDDPNGPGGIFVEAPRFRAALIEEEIAAGLTFDVLDGIAKALRVKKGVE
jgi:hypothetical protein